MRSGRGSAEKSQFQTVFICDFREIKLHFREFRVPNVAQSFSERERVVRIAYIPGIYGRIRQGCFARPRFLESRLCPLPVAGKEECLLEVVKRF